MRCPIAKWRFSIRPTENSAALTAASLAFAILTAVCAVAPGDEPTVEELLQTIKPPGAPEGHVAPSSYAKPQLIRRSLPPGAITSNPQASKLWGVPLPNVTSKTKPVDVDLWNLHPSESPAYRALAGNGTRNTSTLDALRDVRYPQYVARNPSKLQTDRALDWQASQAPDAAQYFKALQQAARRGAPPKPDSRVARAQAHVDYGFDLIRRGAAHSAEAEFVDALWAIAHANDARTGTRKYSDQLRQSLKTLSEVEDFSSLVRDHLGTLEVQRKAAQHQSPIARRVVKERLDAITAMQVYLDQSQSQLIEAIAGDGAGADALYGLSRTIQVKSQNGSAASNLAGAKAMAMLLAAQRVRPGDAKISNELGVLYARFGELKKAESMLKRSLLANERPESWHNLSRIWGMAGKETLASYAVKRSRQLQSSGSDQSTPTARFVAAEEMIAMAPPPREYTLPTSVANSRKSKRDGALVVATSSAEANSQTKANVKKPNWLQRLFGPSEVRVASNTETIE